MDSSWFQGARTNDGACASIFRSTTCQPPYCVASPSATARLHRYFISHLIGYIAALNCPNSWPVGSLSPGLSVCTAPTISPPCSRKKPFASPVILLRIVLFSRITAQSLVDVISGVRTAGPLVIAVKGRRLHPRIMVQLSLRLQEMISMSAVALACEKKWLPVLGSLMYSADRHCRGSSMPFDASAGMCSVSLR